MKKLFKSKTFWTGLLTVGFGIAQCVKGQTDTGVQTIAAGLGMIFLRHGISKGK